MTKIRKLQRKGEDGTWHNDAYAIETRKGRITLRYSLAWEYLGGRYNRMIQEQNLSLEQLEQVLSGDSVRWMPIETFETNFEETLHSLDRECCVPHAPAALTSRRIDRHAQAESIILEAHIVDGQLQLNAPQTGPIRARGDSIYLEDGRQLQIALAMVDERATGRFDEA
ncbi:MAG: hypothetical protein U9R15_14425 [Chloroflexota bacterium]|nr:hypothetical protein [Chloroflexota bacterium]